MIRDRCRLGVVVIALLLASSSIPAWAHPGHPPAESRTAAVGGWTSPDDGAEHTGAPLAAASHARPHQPSSLVLIAAALGLIAGLPNRRRTLGLVLAVLLAGLALQGVFHAVQHVWHVAHPNGLTIGAAPVPAGLAVVAGATPAADLRRIAGDVTLVRETPGSDTAITPSRGRAPPAVLA